MSTEHDRRAYVFGPTAVAAQDDLKALRESLTAVVEAMRAKRDEHNAAYSDKSQPMNLRSIWKAKAVTLEHWSTELGKLIP